MKLFLLMFVYAVLILAVQSVWQIPGNFLLLAVIYMGFYLEWRLGFVISLMFGFFLDSVSLFPFGISLFSFAVVFGFIRFFRKKILFQTLLSRLSWVGLLSLLSGTIVFGALTFLGDTGRSVQDYFPRMLLGAVVNAFLGLFWFKVLDWYCGLTLQQLVKEQDILLKK